MATPACYRAITDVLEHGKALLKFISSNNVGLTGSHECGYYLPKNSWELFTPFPPVKGENKEHFVKILWPDGRVTESCVKWYGVGTRGEYRLTKFGVDFPWLTHDRVGDLLVLIPKSINSFIAHVLDNDSDIEEIIMTLGVEIISSWCIYDQSIKFEEETEDKCVNRFFREFALAQEDFPNNEIFSKETLNTLTKCIIDFNEISPDKKILDLYYSEYELFKIIERKIYQDQISRLFQSVDDFINTALPIINRRKSRAGRSLENHVEYILKEEHIPFDIRPDIDGKPDIIVPGINEYLDPNFPKDKLLMIGIKTTCKDRWRQVLNEAKRIDKKHLFTLQHGISSKQLQEMKDANVQLIVPKSLQKEYPPENRVDLLSFEHLIKNLKDKYLK